MAQIRLKVSISGGTPDWREFDASSLDEALRTARQNGLRVLSIDEAREHPKSRPSGRFPLLLFTQEFLSLLEAGLGIMEALETLRRKENAPVAREVLDRLILGLREGKSLSEVFSFYPEIFPAIYMAGVRASERTGQLQVTLARYVVYRLRLDAVRKKVVSSAIYPVVLISAGVLVTLFLLGYVVPKFSLILEGASRNASAASRILLRLGLLIAENPAPVWGSFFTFILLAAISLSQKNIRARIAHCFSELPLIRPFMRTMSLARFYRTVALLLDAGIPLLRALEMAASLLPPKAALELTRVRERVRAGSALSAALSGSALLTPIAESLIKVGERGGKLAEMMERSARFLDEELDRRADRFVRLFEPLLMAFIGLIIGAVVVLMYMPIFDLVGSF
ncbi:MAG: type II secretion system F family protein [Candidatus Accumulibacter sp.]|jgi:general secretion pathway protein F|nr:type II secretion system F family protein [Accumulibacter sp.]